MKAEPLKGKGKYCDGRSKIECSEPEQWFHDDEDIKLAVQWFIHEFLYHSTIIEQLTKEQAKEICDLMAKAFEDVVKK